MSKIGIINAVKNVKNHDLLAVKVAEQLPRTILEKQRISDIAQSVVKADGANALIDGSIDRDFYETHLKRGAN